MFGAKADEQTIWREVQCQIWTPKNNIWYQDNILHPMVIPHFHNVRSKRARVVTEILQQEAKSTLPWLLVVPILIHRTTVGHSWTLYMSQSPYCTKSGRFECCIASGVATDSSAGDTNTDTSNVEEGKSNYQCSQIIHMLLTLKWLKILSSVWSFFLSQFQIKVLVCILWHKTL